MTKLSLTDAEISLIRLAAAGAEANAFIDGIPYTEGRMMHGNSVTPAYFQPRINREGFRVY